MEFTAKQIADFIGGRVEGNELAAINTFAKIEEGKKGAISFLSNLKYLHYIYDTESSIVLVNEDVKFEKPVKPTLIRVKDAYESVAKLLQIYASMQPKKKGIDSLAFIHPSATIGKDCYIGPFVAIGPDVTIGDGCVLHPHVTIGEKASVGSNTEIYSNAVVYHHCKVGSNCVLHAGCVIGADGFGFAPNQAGYEKIPQVGIVIIEDNVEIGANTCVDRSTMGQTVIHKGAKLDNLIQVAHNCEVGENTVMSAQVGMAGSTKIGSWCMVGGQAGFAGHIHVADRTMVGAQSGVISNTKGNGENLLGSPAMDPKDFFKAKALYRRLPDMYKEISALRKEIEELKKKQS